MNNLPSKELRIDPRQAPETRDLYYTTKDLRAAARQKERFGDLSPAVLGQWKIIHQNLAELFTAGSADLELCGWLVESSLRLEGCGGLERAFDFICQLTKLHGTNLSSVEPADQAPHYWMAPISELSGEGSEGVLIQPIRLHSLVPNCRYGENSLWHYQSNIQHRDGEAFLALSQAAFSAGEPVMREQKSTILSCINTYQDLIAQFEVLFPDIPPSSANIITILRECVHAIDDLMGFKDNAPLDLETLEKTDTSVERFSDFTSRSLIGNREQALQILADVALFFRNQEPQSPIAPALETLIRRGRLSFASLLEDLLSDRDARRNILVAAGIQSTHPEEH